MSTVFVIPMVLQGLALLVDEVYFHHRREMPRWERIGHPLDTLTVLLCFAYLLGAQQVDLNIYLVLSVFSCAFVTKDEFIHAKICTGGESWLHAVLFILHPMTLAAAYWLNQNGFSHWLWPQMGLTILLLVYQVFYWNFFKPQQNPL